MLNPRISEIVEYLLANFDGDIEISTNGEPHTTEWWTKFAAVLAARGHVIFGIDGLADTHAIYRAGTDWQTIINNATAFIAGGGRAHWQFIPFAHNEHQILPAIKLSQQLKFERFFLKDERPAEAIGMERWSRSRLETPKQGTKKEHCLYMKGTVYLAADGKFSPCCFIGDKQQYKTTDLEDYAERLETLWQTDSTTPQECKDFCHRNLESV